jgi:hypothetical protein
MVHRRSRNARAGLYVPQQQRLEILTRSAREQALTAAYIRRVNVLRNPPVG